MLYFRAEVMLHRLSVALRSFEHQIFLDYSIDSGPSTGYKMDDFIDVIYLMEVLWKHLKEPQLGPSYVAILRSQLPLTAAEDLGYVPMPAPVVAANQKSWCEIKDTSGKAILVN